MGKKAREVLQFDLNGKFLKHHESILSAAIFMNKNDNSGACNIGKCCVGKLTTCYGHKWAFKTEENEHLICDEELEQIEPTDKFILETDVKKHLINDLAKEKYYLQDLEKTQLKFIQKGKTQLIKNCEYLIDSCKKRLEKLDAEFKKQVRLGRA